MEDKYSQSSSENKYSDISVPPSSASQESKVQITEDEFITHTHKNNLQYFDGRRIHRVPQHLRSPNKNMEEDYYTPQFVSLGPYHYGSPQLCTAQLFKPQLLQILVSGSGLTWEALYSEIFNVIDQVRSCYVGISCDDNLLTEIMLLDSCFFICLMKMSSISEQAQELGNHFAQQLGISAFSYVSQDMYLLENQIPLWLIQLLVTLIYSNNKEEGSVLLCNGLSQATYGDNRVKSMPSINFGNKQPLHFLDACRLLNVSGSSGIVTYNNNNNNNNNAVQKPKPVSKCFQQLCGRKGGQSKFGKLDRQFRSVTDLKAKGILFRPSSYCLKDIEFKSYAVFAVLRLPRFLFTHNSKRYFLNMIAYESSPESVIGVDIICYLNSLKSLILKPQDVRELREKKVLFSSLESDEQVFQVIKEIDTSGLYFAPVFDEVKDRIEEHCSSKARTWIAEFFNTYFRSPWTAIALVAITFQLCLSVVQTYYAVHPAS